MFNKIPAEPRKILIIRLSSIGDIILTTPVIRQLRKRFPSAQIDYLVGAKFREILAAEKNISNLLTYDTAGDDIALPAIVDYAKKQRYELIVDLHRSLRSRRICMALRGVPVLKYRKQVIRRFLLVKTRLNLYPKGKGAPKKVARKYLEAVARLGVDLNDIQPALTVDEAARKAAHRRWAALGRGNFRVVMAPGAHHFSKRWPTQFYAELIRMIYENNGWRTVLLGGPMETDIAEAIAERCGEELIENLVSGISLQEAFAMIETAPFFISNDTGLMHAAAAFQRPQIAIFGSTVEELGFYPVNPRALVIENEGLSCRPCSHIGRENCPKKHFKCMYELTPALVFTKFQQLVRSC